MKEYISFDIIKSIVDEFTESEVKFALSGGEPLLHPEIKDIVAYLIQKNIRFDIITNGVLLKNTFTAEYIASNGIGLQISLDGATRETYSKVRGGDSWDSLFEYMSELNAVGYTKGRINFTINKLNLGEIEQAFYMVLLRGFLPQFSFVTPTGKAEGNWNKLGLSIKEKIECYGVVNQLMMKNRDEIQKRFSISDYKTIRLNPIYKCPLVENEGVNPLVKVNGDVQPCQRLYDEEYCIGNIFTYPIKNILGKDNVRIKGIKETLRAYVERRDDLECENCAIKAFCRKGCFGSSTKLEDCMVNRVISIARCI